jgi:hypothetical protein
MWWEREKRVHADKRAKAEHVHVTHFVLLFACERTSAYRCTMTNDAMRKEQVEFIPFHTAQNGRLHEW